MISGLICFLEEQSLFDFESPDCDSQFSGLTFITFSDWRNKLMIGKRERDREQVDVRKIYEKKKSVLRERENGVGKVRSRRKV